MPPLATTDRQSKGKRDVFVEDGFYQKLYGAANLDTSDLYVLVTSLEGVCSHYVGISQSHALTAEMLYH